MSSLASNKVLLYAFVALAIVCVVASIFTMSFSLFFVTVAICIVVYIVYRVRLDQQRKKRLQESEQAQAALDDDDDGNDGGVEEEDEEDEEDEEVYQVPPMPVVVRAPAAQLVIDRSQQKKKGKKTRRRKKVEDPTPEDIEKARLLGLRAGRPSRAQKTYNRVNKTRGPNTLQTPNARVITKLSGRKQAFSDMHVDRFANGNELHPRRKRPNRAKDSSGYGQLSSWRADPNLSVSENAARRAMVHGAILPEPKHARRRLMRGILKRFPLRPAPGMIRIPEGAELPCAWNDK